MVGTSGSGKTTTARLAAGRLNLPHCELDSIHWGPEWVPVERGHFRRQVSEFVSMEAWVVDGNYSSVRDLVWPRATHVVWLDYRFPLVAYRILSRTIRRALTREVLWSGNRESFRKMFSRDSILIWVLKTYWRRRREMPVLMTQPEHQHLHLLRHRSPADTERWLGSLGSGT